MIKIARQCETLSGAARPRHRPLFDEHRVEDGGMESDETEGQSRLATYHQEITAISFFNESTGTKVGKWKQKKNFWTELKRLEIYISSNFFPSSAGRGIQIRSRAERSSSAKTQRGTRSSVCRRPCFKDDSRLQKKRGGVRGDVKG